MDKFRGFRPNDRDNSFPCSPAHLPPCPFGEGWQQWRPAFLAVAFALAIVLSTSPSNQTAQRLPVQLRSQQGVGYGSGGQPVNLEPGNITDGNSVVVQIYNRLIEFKAGTTELEPSLDYQVDCF